jgi:hypothetical protein
MNNTNSTAPRFQVHIIRDIIGTDYSVVDTTKPSFHNGHSNSIGYWSSLSAAQEVADQENKKAAK